MALSHTATIRVGATLVLLAMTTLTAMTVLHPPIWVSGIAYFVAGAGMGLTYPRTSVLAFKLTADADAGSTSSALGIADSGGPALALAVAGLIFSVEGTAYGYTFVFGGCAILAAAGAACSGRVRSGRATRSLRR